MISLINCEFGQEDELMENKELVHEYLGITIDYLIAGKVLFTMFDYLEDVIVRAAKDLKIVVHTIQETFSYSSL